MIFPQIYATIIVHFLLIMCPEDLQWSKTYFVPLQKTQRYIQFVTPYLDHASNGVTQDTGESESESDTGEFCSHGIATFCQDIVLVCPGVATACMPPYIHHQSQPRWLSGMRRSHVHSLMIARRSLCPEKLGSNPGQGSKGINFSGWHGLDMSITVTKRR